jgi:hypothetical protein
MRASPRAVTVRTGLSEVPIEYRRKAIDHLESIRGTEMAPAGGREAELADEAYPIYRPDIDGAAYWEFEIQLGGVVAPRTIATSEALANPEFAETLRESAAERGEGEAGPLEGLGFIMVSTGEHDYPVPHWSLERPPVSRQLEAEAGESGAAVARIYKLDALAYVGENDAGEEVARSGQTPAPFEGLGHDLGRQSGAISSLKTKPQRGANEEKAREIKHSVTRAGPGPPEVRPADPKDWPRLKERYGDAFGPFLDVLRKRAAEPWKIDKAVAKFGEGVMAGEPFKIGLLRREAAIEVTGEGAGLVDLELDDKPGKRPKVHGRARKSPHGRETDFEVRVRYPDGEEETLRYFIVSRDTPSNVRAERQSGGGPE